ncbi:MAG: TetR/AcrR family transcriptional regulator [Nocardiaceae bacterium]|nr:TetR/AcrR family transcriptional regulator [Nocardiaceae bacterium]
MSQSTTSDGRSQRWDEHKEQRRARILDSAIAVIEESGVDFSVQAIAAQTGLPRPVVYRHFKDRADLDEQIRRRILKILMAELLPSLQPAGTVGEAIAHAVTTYVLWTEKHPRLHHFLGTGVDKPAVSGARGQISSALTTLFVSALSRTGADIAPARPMAYGTIGFVDGVVSSWRTSPNAPAEQIVSLLTASLISLLETTAKEQGIDLDRTTPVVDLLG